MARARKRKHVPHRTCVACRTIRPKRELVRVVRTPAGEVLVDQSGKRSGRGAYLCPVQACWEAAVKRGTLGRALRITLTEGTRAELLNHGTNLHTRPASES